MHKRPYRTLRWLAALACAFCLLCPSVSAQQPKAAPAIPDPPLVDLAGYQKLLAEQRDKPVWVNFWATWCEPCRDEYPVVNELAKKYAAQGLVVIGVSLDDEGEMTLVRRFLARNQPIFQNYRKLPGRAEAFINGVHAKWSGAIPASFFYARDGRLLKYLVGEHTREEFEAIVRELLDASRSSAGPHP